MFDGAVMKTLCSSVVARLLSGGGWWTLDEAVVEALEARWGCSCNVAVYQSMWSTSLWIFTGLLDVGDELWRV